MSIGELSGSLMKCREGGGGGEGVTLINLDME